MSSGTIVLIWVLAAAALALLAYVSWRGVVASPPGVRPVGGLLPVQVSGESPIEVGPASPERILVAVDGSPCSDCAVQRVASRPWPPGSIVEVVSVAHTRVPSIPDPELMIEAAHVQGLEAERVEAPLRVTRATRPFERSRSLQASGKVLEGRPAEQIIEEARRWSATLIVVGSHGLGPVRRRLLGSVSQAVAIGAPCSVEIVRCGSTA